MSIPVLGYAMKLGDFIPVNRDGRADSAIESIRVARRVLEKGLHITTFVEGTRSSDGRLLPFKQGPFTSQWKPPRPASRSRFTERKA